MKKVLFATTALIMTAGAAAAEVAVSGDGRMGVVYDGTDWNFTSRIRIKFTASGETDGGLTFGGSARADHYNTDSADGDTSSAANGASGSVYISGAFGKLEMGDVDSAAENAVGDVSGVGLTGLGDTNETTFITSSVETAGDPHLLYSYSAGDLSFYLSLSDGTDNVVNIAFGGGFSTGGSVDGAYSVGVAYAMGDYKVGLGYEVLDIGGGADINSLTLGGSATFGAATVKAVYGQIDFGGGADFDQYGVSVDYTVGAAVITAFYRSIDIGGSIDSYGIGASYDLGGGASMVGGVVDSDWNTDTVADFGVKFTF